MLYPRHRQFRSCDCALSNIERDGNRRSRGAVDSLEAVLVNGRSRFGNLAPTGNTAFLLVLGQDVRQRFFR
jgi:hypothetical protein